MRFVVQLGDRTLGVEVEEGAGRFLVTIGGERLEVDARAPWPGAYSLLIDGVSHLVEVREETHQILIEVGGETYRLGLEDEFRARLRGRIAAASLRGGQIVKAPMPGRVVSLLVGLGDRVEAGAGLIIVEAMKMENELRAAASGEVKEIRVAAGDAVSTGQVLLVLE